MLRSGMTTGPARIARLARNVGLIIVLVATGSWILAMLFADRIIFRPMMHPDGDWDAVRRLDVPVIDARIRTADGVTLHGWYAEPAAPPRAALLILHGNAGNVTHRLHLLRTALELRGAVLLVDWRGYGKSEGRPDEAGLYRDAEAAHAWLCERGHPASRIVVYGESLGAAVAVELARRVPTAGIILQSAFMSIGDMARTILPVPGIGLLIRTRMATVDKIAALRVPKLHFHGGRDDVVPIAQGLRLFQAAAEPKSWVAFPDVSHNDWPGGRRAEWIAAMDRFLGEILR